MQLFAFETTRGRIFPAPSGLRLIEDSSALSRLAHAVSWLALVVHVLTARFHVPLALPRIACMFFTVISHASTILSIAHPLTDLVLCSALEFWFPPLHFPRIIFPYLHSCSTPRIPSLSPEGPLPAVWLPVICSAGLLPTPNSSSPYVTLPSFPRFFGPSFLSRSVSFRSFLSFLMFAGKPSYLS